MKRRSVVVVALAVALVFLFAASAFASFLAPTSAKTWNWMNDYYTWGETQGTSDVIDPMIQLGSIGDNPTQPGVHANYMASTAKCGICHSVHRAAGAGVQLLETNNPTCAGCHVVGSTVTNVVVNWGTGPHRAGDTMNCQFRACHVNNPHGANGSQWAIVAAALLNRATDALLVTPTANSVASGISAAQLDAVEPSATIWPASTQSLVRTGYNCAICHSSSTFAVLNRGWADQRHTNILGTQSPTVLKQGHIGVATITVDAAELWVSNGVTTTVVETTQTAFAGVTDCESCHDQTDTRTSSGWTFPHGQVVSTSGASPTLSNLPVGQRSFLWMGWAGGVGQPRSAITTHSMKAYDGNCLKCHRNNAGTAGVGISY